MRRAFISMVMCWAVTPALAQEDLPYPGCVDDTTPLIEAWRVSVAEAIACNDEFDETGEPLVACRRYLKTRDASVRADRCRIDAIYFFDEAERTVKGYKAPADVKAFIKAGAGVTKALRDTDDRIKMYLKMLQLRAAARQ